MGINEWSLSPEDRSFMNESVSLGRVELVITEWATVYILTFLM